MDGGIELGEEQIRTDRAASAKSEAKRYSPSSVATRIPSCSPAPEVGSVAAISSITFLSFIDFYLFIVIAQISRQS